MPKLYTLPSFLFFPFTHLHISLYSCFSRQCLSFICCLFSFSVYYYLSLFHFIVILSAPLMHFLSFSGSFLILLSCDIYHLSPEYPFVGFLSCYVWCQCVHAAAAFCNVRLRALNLFARNFLVSDFLFFYWLLFHAPTIMTHEFYRIKTYIHRVKFCLYIHI